VRSFLPWKKRKKACRNQHSHFYAHPLFGPNQKFFFTHFSLIEHFTSIFNAALQRITLSLATKIQAGQVA
jgi:hypothetical protein